VNDVLIMMRIDKNPRIGFIPVRDFLLLTISLFAELISLILNRGCFSVIIEEISEVYFCEN